jgi:hypothetical protein
MKMKKQILLFTLLLFGRYGQTQVSTVLDSLDNPIAITFVGDNLFILLHGKPFEGKLISYNINDPTKTIKIHLDSLTYPRAIIEKDSIIYIGLPSAIISYDLRSKKPEFKEVYTKSFFFPRSFGFVGSELYFAEETGLSMIDLSASPIKIIQIYSFNQPLSLAIEGHLIYVAVRKSIFKYDLQSKKMIELIKDLEFRPYTVINIDNILYMDYGDLGFIREEIIAFNLSKPKLGYEVFCDEVIGTICLKEHKGSIYIASQVPVFNGKPEGKILRIDKTLINQPKINGLTIYPNPTPDNVCLTGLNIEDMNFKLFDSNGKLIYSDTNITSIDMSQFPKGVYYLSFENVIKNVSGTKKIVRI